MANSEAWQAGWELGTNAAAHRRARKEALSDEERQTKAQTYATQLAGLRDKLSSYPKGSQEYSDTVNAMQSTLGEIRELYHPEKNPGAIQRLGHVVTDTLRITNPQDRIKAEAGKRENASIGDERMAQGIASSAPRSPEEQATQDAQAHSAGALAAVRAGQKAFIDLYPNSTPEEQTANLNALVQQHFGITGRGSWTQVSGKINGEPVTLNFDKNTNRYTYPSGEPVPLADLQPGHWVPDPKPSAAAKPPKGLKYDTATGMVRDQDTGKLYSMDDVGKQGTPPEVLAMFNGAKTMMDKKQQNALALANERGRSIGENRFGSFIDPANPTEVIPVRFGEAAARGLHLAVGSQYQAISAMLKSATSGPIGNEIVAFSTALQHADLLEQAATDLNNSDTRAWNNVKNSLATQFGDEAPTNFNTIAGAYTREVTKALTAGHVTDNEIKENGATIPQNASPQQIMGAIRAYRQLMQSKINIRVQQIKSVLPTVPFAGGGNVPPQGSPKTTKGARSLKAAMALPQNKGKSESDVAKDLESHGYTVTRP